MILVYLFSFSVIFQWNRLACPLSVQLLSPRYLSKLPGLIPCYCITTMTKSCFKLSNLFFPNWLRTLSCKWWVSSLSVCSTFTCYSLYCFIVFCFPMIVHGNLCVACRIDVIFHIPSATLNLLNLNWFQSINQSTASITNSQSQIGLTTKGKFYLKDKLRASSSFISCQPQYFYILFIFIVQNILLDSLFSVPLWL